MSKPYVFSDELLAAAQSAARYQPYSMPVVLGRDRTPYFYRKMAISCARDARIYRNWANTFPNIRETFEYLAKSYLASYRKLKGVSA